MGTHRIMNTDMCIHILCFAGWLSESGSMWSIFTTECLFSYCVVCSFTYTLQLQPDNQPAKHNTETPHQCTSGKEHSLHYYPMHTCTGRGKVISHGVNFIIQQKATYVRTRLISLHA